MTPDEIVDVVTPEQVKATIQSHLDELGLTFEELKTQAESGEFQSGKARVVWSAIERFVTPA